MCPLVQTPSPPAHPTPNACAVRRSFLSIVPRLHIELQRLLLAAGLVRPGWVLPPVLRVGSWIGGDRDGNPFVNADTLKYALSRQSQVIDLRHRCAGLAAAREVPPCSSPASSSWSSTWERSTASAWSSHSRAAS